MALSPVCAPVLNTHHLEQLNEVLVSGLSLSSVNERKRVELAESKQRSGLTLVISPTPRGARRRPARIFRPLPSTLMGGLSPQLTYSSPSASQLEGSVKKEPSSLMNTRLWPHSLSTGSKSRCGS